MTKYLTWIALGLWFVAGCQRPPTFDEEKDGARRRFDHHKARFKYALALEQFQSGQVSSAHESILETIALDPEEPAYILLLAKLQIEQGDLAKAAGSLRMITYRDHPIAEHHYIAGLLAERYERPEEAVTHYFDALELDRLNRDYLMAHTEMLVHLGRHDDALAMLDDRLNDFDGHWSLHALRGDILRLQGRAAEAAAAFEQASLNNRDDHTLAEAHALTLYEAGNYAQALPALRRIYRRDPSQADPHIARALAASSIAVGDDATARLLLEDILRRVPDDAVAWSRLARCALQQDDVGSASQAAHEAARLAPERASYQALLGMVHYRAGHWPAALRALENAARIDPEQVSTWCLMGRVARSAGAIDRARTCLQRAAAIAPNDVLVRRLLVDLGPDPGAGVAPSQAAPAEQEQGPQDETRQE